MWIYSYRNFVSFISNIVSSEPSSAWVIGTDKACGMSTDGGAPQAVIPLSERRQHGGPDLVAYGAKGTSTFGSPG